MKEVPLSVLVLVVLGACASAPVDTRPREEVLRGFGRSAPQEPAAGGRPAQPVRDDSTLVIGAGFTSGPHTHAFGAALDFPIAEHWTLGPAVQWGVTDDRTLAFALVQAKRSYPLGDPGEPIRRLLPYGIVGAGVAFLEEDVGPGDVDDSELVFAIGGGARYSFNERWTVGSEVQFCFLPDDLLDERFFTSWQVAQLVLTF